MTKRKPRKQKKTSTPSTPSSQARASVRMVPVSSEQDDFLRKLFWGSLIAFGLITLALSLGSGINGDDEYQDDYSAKLVDYYTSFGRDTAALYIEDGNMHLYGGFFDLTTGLLNRAFGWEIDDANYHHLRHLFSALFGILGMLFAGLLVREIAGWRAAVLALVLLFLSPRFLGHSLMNPKDIPFATGNIMALYYLVRWLDGLPKPRWQDMAGLAAGIALAIATRAGGILLIAYLGLFAGLHFLQTYGLKGLSRNTRELGRYALYGLGVAIAGYLVAVLFWPYALVDPLSHPLEALSEFSKLGVRIRVLFQGENVMSDETAWYYPLVWIFYTIPPAVLLGFAGSLALAWPMLRKFRSLPVFLLYFTAIFPAVYVIYKDSLLHDGWRHLTFLYPSMAALAALWWVLLEDYLRGQKIARYLAAGILVVCLLEPALFIARNSHYPYVYFNPLAGGMKGAYGQFETDYWGVSVRQAVQRLEREGILRTDLEKPITIASSFSYNLQRYVNKKYGDKVIATYVRYNDRYERSWDYAIFPTRYVRGAHLREGVWPPASQTLFTVDANGVPLTAVLQDQEKFAYRGEVAAKQKDWPLAVQEFSQEVGVHPDNELAWLGLANAYLNNQQAQQAIPAAEKALEIAPDNLSGLYYLGLARVNSGDTQGALDAFRRSTEVDPTYSIGYYYQALILQASGDLNSAVALAEKSYLANPRFKPAYELAAQLYEQLGRADRANELRQAAQKIQ